MYCPLWGSVRHVQHQFFPDVDVQGEVRAMNANNDNKINGANGSSAKAASPKRKRNGARNVLIGEVDREVEELFFRIHDRDNPLHRKAFEQHVQLDKRARRGKLKDKAVARISEPQVLKSIVKHRVLDACEDLAILEREAAGARLQESRRHVITQLGVRTGHFLDDGESIDIYRLLVVKKDKAEEASELKSLVGFCKGLTKGESKVPVEELCNGSVPAEFEARPDFKAFLSDLGLLFVNEGDAARQLAARVCDEESFARKVVDDDELPKPLRYLASISLQVCGLSAKASEQDHVVGFDAEG